MNKPDPNQDAKRRATVLRTAPPPPPLLSSTEVTPSCFRSPPADAALHKEGRNSLIYKINPTSQPLFFYKYNVLSIEPFK